MAEISVKTEEKEVMVKSIQKVNTYTLKLSEKEAKIVYALIATTRLTNSSVAEDIMNIFDTFHNKYFNNLNSCKVMHTAAEFQPRIDIEKEIKNVERS